MKHGHRLQAAALSSGKCSDNEKILGPLIKYGQKLTYRCFVEYNKNEL